jgi:hypothetical protein
VRVRVRVRVPVPVPVRVQIGGDRSRRGLHTSFRTNKLARAPARNSQDTMTTISLPLLGPADFPDAAAPDCWHEADSAPGH